MPRSKHTADDQMSQGSTSWPVWLPDEVKTYLTHVERGAPLRELARRAGCHPSTIMRQVRRVESRRDDPLVDAALRNYSAGPVTETKSAMDDSSETTDGCDEDTLRREGMRVLRRMCETGAVLAVVPDMEKAVVVRETPSGTTQRVAVVETAVAQAMALKDWIACKTPGRISRYAITTTGRSALSQLMAKAENLRSVQAMGMAEAPAGFTHADPVATEAVQPSRRVRYGLSETPLSVLGRRRGRDGNPFLEAELVAAGERLREDFELAQMGPRVTQDWNRFLTGPSDGGGASHGGGGASSEGLRALKRRCMSWGRGLATWRCAVAAISKVLKLPKKNWDGRRAQAKLFCASHCSVSNGFTMHKAAHGPE